MTHAVTNKPLKVSTDYPRRPIIDLPESQLAEVQRLLDENGIRYWVSDSRISFNGGPYMAKIKLWKAEEAAKAQAVLDAAT